ncbi:ATP-binding protein [Acutalibacter sp. 1XD8-36]|uniref:ATP-binding protein n=1 Tax=Acutalibacter sp. 1XD8-36 TaxID=2320852 RepID=UPI002ED22E68
MRKIEHGVVETTDGRYLKILEIEPINFMLRSDEEQFNIISTFASWLKISPMRLQFKSITRKRRRAQGLQDRYLYDYTFANDNGQNPLMKKAHAYADNWKQAYQDNTGLLLFGDVGTGKSFFAGCIANALLDRDIPVLMTNFPSILNRLTGMFSEDRADFIASLGMYDLLIIDDLGVERNTEYAMEQMFHVIDCRYRSRKPMIITTNLKLEEIKNPPDLAHARIYDRILERCAPILFDGKNFREENAETTKAAAKGIISQK